jgi:hypothetical protein
VTFLRVLSQTRADAMASDLRDIRAVLDRAAIACLLVRGDDDRPVIAVDRARRSDLEAAFAQAFADEPFYARLDDGAKRSERRLGTGRLPGDDAELFLLYRRRPRESRAGWKIAEAAVRLELWTFGEEEIVAPRPNALTRSRIPRVDAVETSVVRGGQEWPTLAGMFDDHADEVDFDIDMVFSWVDGSEPGYVEERQRWGVLSGLTAGALPTDRRAALRPAQRARVRPVGAPHLRRE